MTDNFTINFTVTHLILASLWCFGFWKAFDDGMIFERPGLWMQKHFPYWLYAPTTGCTICMASFHGLVFYVAVVGLDWQAALFVVCLSGLNFLLSQLVRE